MPWATGPCHRTPSYVKCDSHFSGQVQAGLAPPADEICTRVHAPGKPLADLEVFLDMEFRFTWRATQRNDFPEGIHAAIIDRGRHPRWRHARLGEISPAGDGVPFAHLAEGEPVLKGGMEG